MEDILQETFLKAVKSSSSFEGRNESSLLTWVCRIAINTVASHNRQQKTVTRNLGVRAEIGEEVSLIDEVQESQEDRLLRREKERHIAESIKSLPKHHRIIVLMRLEELSIKEIVKITATKENTVKSRLSRARSKLRPILRDKGIMVADKTGRFTKF